MYLNNSIISSIVLYKHSFEDISETLNCLINTSFIKKVILVDNDQSTWANMYEHPKVIYLKTDGNFGFGYGHNLAIKKYVKNSDFFLICNPDIVFEISEFEKLVGFATTCSEGLFLPKIVYENGDNQYGARLLPSPLNLFARRFSKKMARKLDRQYLLQEYSIQKPIFVPYLSGCFMLFRSECLDKLCGFDERFFMYMEDIDISRRCAEEFGTVYYPLCKIIHKHEQASYKSSKLLKAHLKSAIQYFNKWGWFYDSKREILNDKCLHSIKMQ